MKKIFLFIISFLSLLVFEVYSCQPKSCSDINCASAKKNTGSKSFFMPRAAIEDVSLFFAINNYYFHRKYFEPNASSANSEIPRIHISRGIFYEKSHHNKKFKKNVSRYFLPGNKCSALVAENGTGDIGSLWESVIAPGTSVYESRITLKPERSILGFYANYHQDFSCINGLWLDVQLALYETKHKLRPAEVILNNVEGTIPGASTALEYLASDKLLYGRIVNCRKNKGMDDIQVKLGYDFLGCLENGYYVGIYGSTLIPTSPRPNAEFLFEPIVGRGFWALGVGFDAGYNAWECEDKSLALMVDLSYQHLFKKTLLRSFDLKKNGDWSRYMRVSTQAEPGVSFPAINFTTLPVSVEPRGVINLWAAAHYQHCKWHFELGYNFWWRQSEKICLKRDKCGNCTNNIDNLNLGIFGMGNVCSPTSASTANITEGKTFSGTGNVVVNDPTFVPLTLKDLNLASASHPKTFTNKVYASVARDVCIICRPVSLGVSASYEFNHNFNAFSQWGIWGNLETSF